MNPKNNYNEEDNDPLPGVPREIESEIPSPVIEKGGSTDFGTPLSQEDD